MFALIIIIIIMSVRLGVPVSDVLLAIPGVMIGFGTLFYYFLNNPDPTILMPNLVPTKQDHHVACTMYQTSLQNGSGIVVEPKEKNAPNGIISSYISSWQVEYKSRPSEIHLVFDIGNRGNKAIMLYEYRLRSLNESKESIIVTLSPETQAVFSKNNKNNLPATGQSRRSDRAFIRPKERITECIQLPIDVPSDSNKITTEFILELYATSNRPVDSLYIQITIDTEKKRIEWQANRSILQRLIRNRIHRSVPKKLVQND